MWPGPEKFYADPAYCAIYGAPIFERNGSTYDAYPDEPGWFADAVLLRPEDKHNPESSHKKILAESKEGLNFQLLYPHKVILSRPRVWPNLPIHFPCHTECVSTAKRVIDSSGSASLQRLWLGMKARFDQKFQDYQPLRYHWCPLVGHGMGRKAEDTDEKRNRERYFGAVPTRIPLVTQSILSHLEYLPLPISTRTRLFPDDGLTSYISRVPPETVTSIMEQLCPLSDPPAECTFLVPPSFWLQALLHGHLLPWLWDLDILTVVEKENSKPAGYEWNWELLVRQLAQSNRATLKTGIWAVAELPLGLRNRKRIWEGVEDLLCTRVNWSPPDSYGF